MDYSWYPAYREALLETDTPNMRSRLLLAEQQMVDRLLTLSQDHGGTPEERKAIANALLGIKNVRTELGGWKRASSAGAA